ncbi:MAG: 50S ribosomal protein L13 [Planctomycetes bacterium]|nr:50S ribosomal protein L13 [Planctomycetota bacterium]
MSTFMPKKETLERSWQHVDADGKVLGRLASHVAQVLMGKLKVTYAPHVDTGDFVIVTNAGKVRLSGKKADKKIYQRFSGYPGGRKETPLKKFQAAKPEQVVFLAVKRMIPNSRLGRQMLRKLKVYAGAEHPHQAQNPKELKVEA